MTRFQWTAKTIKVLVWRTLDGESSHAIAARLGCIERTVREMQWELELAPRKDVHRWTRKEQALLRKLYANGRTDAIAKQLGVTPAQVWREAKRLGLRKSMEVIREMSRERSSRPDHGGIRTRFKKGLVPANKGLRRPGWAPGRMRETQFKKGERRGAANRNWKPIGTILIDADGYQRIKVREHRPGEHSGFGNTKVWPLLQRQVWEQHRGPIPPGHTVVFRDGRKENCAIENLELISRAELMRRNTIHNRYPKEMVNTIMMLGAVKRRLRERCQKTQ